MKDYKNRNSTLYLRERKRLRLGPVLGILVLVVLGIVFAIWQLQPDSVDEGPTKQASSEASTAIPLQLPPASPIQAQDDDRQ
jgi:hypothetical protein